MTLGFSASVIPLRNGSVIAECLARNIFQSALGSPGGRLHRLVQKAQQLLAVLMGEYAGGFYVEQF